MDTLQRFDRIDLLLARIHTKIDCIKTDLGALQRKDRRKQEEDGKQKMHTAVDDILYCTPTIDLLLVRIHTKIYCIKTDLDALQRKDKRKQEEDGKRKMHTAVDEILDCTPGWRGSDCEFKGALDKQDGSA